MSLQHNIILCTLCNREFARYNKKDARDVFGIFLTRSKTYKLILTFVENDKSNMNKHICVNCIDDIVNNFTE